MRAVLLLLALATRAGATPLYISGFEDTDCSSQTTACDTFSLTTEAGTGADSTLYTTSQNVSSTDHDHNAENGGYGSSGKSMAVRITTTTTRYRETLPITLSHSGLSVGFALHVEDVPATGGNKKSIACIRESDASDGCCVEINSDRTLNLRYDTSAIGTTGEKVEQKACWSTTDKSSLTPCTVDGDCDAGAGYGCGNASDLCSVANGAGCFWAGLELVQENLSGGQVSCSLWFNGRKSVAGTLTPASAPVSMSSIRLGAIAGDTGNLTAFFDDLVIDSSNRAGHGYVAWAGPGADGTIVGTWTADGCGAGSLHSRCLDEVPLYTSGNDYLRTSSPSKLEEWRATPITVSDSSVTMTAVEAVLMGRSGTANAGSRDMHQRLFVCTNDYTQSCGTQALAAADLFSVAADTTDRILRSTLNTVAPVSGGSTEPWSASSLTRIGVRFGSEAAFDQQVRGATALVYARVQRPDAPTRPTLKDHNKGTDDGFVTLAFAGHSNSLGTQGGTCRCTSQGGTCATFAGDACSQTDHCSWDTHDQDKPSGGCAAIDTVCQTCVDRRGESNGGAGFQCTADSQCPETICPGGSCSAGTCSGGSEAGQTCGCDTTEGLCRRNANVPCTVDGDCDDLGADCDTTATCTLSCGTNGVCSQGTGYVGLIADDIGANTILGCGQGAEGLQEFIDNRFVNVLDGDDPNCTTLAGLGGFCACTVNGDCPGGGTCTSNKCVGGSRCGSKVNCKVCASNADCGGNECNTGRCVCKFDPPDYLVMHNAGAAEMLGVNLSPNCSESAGGHLFLQGACWTNRCPLTQVSHLCISDTEAQASTRTPPDGSPTAICLGVSRNDGATPCSTGTCTVSAPGCTSNADCPTPTGGTRQVCRGGDVSDPYPKGFCGCDADDAKCPAGFACKNNFCRYECGRCSVTTTTHCGTNSDCPGVETCNTATNADCWASAGGAAYCDTGFPKVCKGRSTCPCDRQTCNTNADCATVQYVVKNLTFNLDGECVSNRCANCGVMQKCGVSGVKNAEDNLGATLHARFAADRYATMQATIDGLSETDGRPYLYATTEPTHRGTGCIHFVDQYQIARSSSGLYDNFAHVCDVQEAVARISIEQAVLDEGLHQGSPIHHGVHYAPVGAELVADTVADCVNSLGVCTRGECQSLNVRHGPPCGATADCPGGAGYTCVFDKGLPTPVRYCQASTGAWTSTICQDAEDCTAVQTCELRPCGCVCRNNADCQNWYGSTHSCKDGSNGACDQGDTCTCKRTSDNVDSCDVVFDTGGQTWACDTTDRRCELSGADACPGSLDACRPE